MKKAIIGLSAVLISAFVIVLAVNAQDKPQETKKSCTEVAKDGSNCSAAASSCAKTKDGATAEGKACDKEKAGCEAKCKSATASSSGEAKKCCETAEKSGSLN